MFLSSLVVLPEKRIKMSSSVRFFFVRHGESMNNVIHAQLRAENNNHLYLTSRQMDPELSARGVTQVQLVADRLAQEAPHTRQIWASYFHRALTTASLIHDKIAPGGAKLYAKSNINIHEPTMCPNMGKGTWSIPIGPDAV